MSSFETFRSLERLLSAGKYMFAESGEKKPPNADKNTVYCFWRLVNMEYAGPPVSVRPRASTSWASPSIDAPAAGISRFVCGAGAGSKYGSLGSDPAFCTGDESSSPSHWRDLLWLLNGGSWCSFEASAMSNFSNVPDSLATSLKDMLLLLGFLLDTSYNETVEERRS